MRAANDPLTESPMRSLAQRAKDASHELSTATSEAKDQALTRMAEALRDRRKQILAANAEDLSAAEAVQKSSAFLDRLALDEGRINGMAKAVEEVLRLKDPVGEVVESWKRPNGLQIQKVRLPLGVVLMIYEARPNVTSDAAALCIKSGNAVILRGGSESLKSNLAIAGALQEGLSQAGLPQAALQVVSDVRRESMLELLELDGLIDLCIPRGGEGLIHFVAQHARIPVVKHYKGVCHVYVHERADLAMAEDIVFNAKVQRPGVCNAAECLLVDRRVADAFLTSVGPRLSAASVELRACPTSLAILRREGIDARAAAPDDYGQEFLDLILAVRVVKDLDQALEHIRRYGSDHTEAIVSSDPKVASRFTREVTASAVIVNASTRFNDGGELGLGAEIGISTTRLHAFGPMGLRELTAQ
jgi:glutamate-5-semialdehyde dehydrogenase